MAETKKEKSLSPSAAELQETNNDAASLKSLANLNLLHQELMQLRASVNQFLYTLSKPDTHGSATSLAASFSEQAQNSGDLLKSFSHRLQKHKEIFDFVNEKYEANPKGLLPFRTHTPNEQAVMQLHQHTPPVRPDQTVRVASNIPPGIEYHEDGLNDIIQINRDWETFKGDHDNITCEKQSETEFLVTLPKPIPFLSLKIALTPLRSKSTSYNLTISSPNIPTTDLHANILKEISQHKKPASFLHFLNLISSYQLIYTEPCHACKKLISATTGDPPILRRWTGTSWTAWHKSC